MAGICKIHIDYDSCYIASPFVTWIPIARSCCE
jgi:hypothetical protein